MKNMGLAQMIRNRDDYDEMKPHTFLGKLQQHKMADQAAIKATERVPNAINSTECFICGTSSVAVDPGPSRIRNIRGGQVFRTATDNESGANRHGYVSHPWWLIIHNRHGYRRSLSVMVK